MLVIEELPDSVDVLTAFRSCPRRCKSSHSADVVLRLEVLLPMKMMIKIGLVRSPVTRP